MEERTTQTRTVSLTLREDGILHIRTLHGMEQGSSDAEKNLEICRQFLDGKEVLILMDLRQGGITDREARQIYANQVEFAIAQAMLVESFFGRIAANIFIRIARPKQQIRLFTSEDEAIQWLKGFLA